MAAQTVYPVNLDVDYPDRELNRVSTLFRVFAMIPILIILGLLANGYVGRSPNGNTSYEYAAAGLIVAPIILMLVFRQKYPRWWFDWNYAFTAFSYRVWSYGSLLRDEYPSTDEEQAVHVTIPYPNAREDLNRWLPLIKWFLAIPHYIVLIFLAIAAVICVVIAWFAILFTGRYPRSLFEFVVGVLRWSLRVSAYAFLLVTDEYPPFSLA